MIKSIPANIGEYNLSLDDVISYLTATGWKFVKNLDGRLLVYTGPENDIGKPALVTLPAKVTFSDFNSRLAEAIRRVSDVEQSTVDAVIERILAEGSDIIYIRLLLPPRSLPSLQVTSRFFQGLRNLVAYSACMEQEPRRYFEQPFAEGKRQAQHFQFAHTYQGSFGFTFESPIERELFTDNPYPPIHRRLLERITYGLSFVERAVSHQDFSEISENYTQGLNANMCKAVVEMLEDIGDNQIEYSVHWSPRLRPLDEKIAAIQPILFGRDALPYLEKAAKYLEETVDKDLLGERTIEGRITELKSTSEEGGMVTLAAEGIGKVNFSLGSEEYSFACNAHRDGNFIVVGGTLTRPRRRLILESPHDLRRITE